MTQKIIEERKQCGCIPSKLIIFFFLPNWKENQERMVQRKNTKLSLYFFIIPLLLIMVIHSHSFSPSTLPSSLQKEKHKYFFIFSHYFIPPLKKKSFFFLPTKTSKLSNIIIIRISVKLKKKCFFSRNMQLYKFDDVFKERKQSAYYPQLLNNIT